MNDHFSDEHLNAFIDNELSSNDKQDLYNAIREDKNLRARCCELQQTQDLLKLSYSDITLPEKYTQALANEHRTCWPHSIAAGFLMLAGTLFGWFANQHLSEDTSLLEFASIVQSNHSTEQKNNAKIMLHVSTSDNYRLNIMLDEAEQLLQANQKNHTKQGVFIEILANGPGLEIVNDNGSPIAKRLKGLQAQYNNLAVSACAQAIKRFEDEKKINFDLLPKTRLVRSAIGQAIKRQKEGWSYIRI